jgi:hypothetical protein
MACKSGEDQQKTGKNDYGADRNHLQRRISLVGFNGPSDHPPLCIPADCPFPSPHVDEVREADRRPGYSGERKGIDGYNRLNSSD